MRQNSPYGDPIIFIENPRHIGYDFILNDKEHKF